MKKPVSSFEKHLPEALAIGLVVVIAIFLGSQWTGSGLRAQTTTPANYTITAELTDEQPVQLGQLPNQQVAQFKLSTTSPTAVEVTSLTFYALGDLRYKISKRLALAPLSVAQRSTVVGTGTEWTQEYGAIQQLVTLEPSLKISQMTPATVDVYADLTKLPNQTFGVELEAIGSPLPVKDLPVVGRLYKTKKFL